MISSVSYVITNGLTYWDDSFQGTALGAAWSVANWSTYTLPSIFPGDYADATYNTKVGAVRTALSEIDTASPYQLDLSVVPYMGAHHGKYQIFGRLNDTTPVGTTDGFIAELVLTGSTGTYSGTLKAYNGSTETSYNFTGGTLNAPEAGMFSVLYTPATGNAKVYWHGILVLDQNITLGASAGNRFGFGMECTVEGGVTLADAFRVQYSTTNNNQDIRNILVASSNGSLYKDSYNGFMTAVSSSLTLGSDRNIQAAEHLQKLYIADNGNPRKVGTANGVDGTTFDDSGVSDWTAFSISAADDVVVISNGTGTVVDGVYAISTVAAGSITLASAAGTGTCSYRIERAPKVYDPAANTLSLLTATAGQVPVGCPLVCTYRDRLVLAGAPVAPHVWYMSRAGDPTDYDYAASEEDGGRAVAGTNIDSGHIGDPITALCPHSDDYLIIGSPSSLWIIRGDPAYGGSIDCLSRNIGIISAGAWCHGPDSSMLFLSREGLFSLAPGGSGYPQPVSRDLLPQELLDIDPATYDVRMAYDLRDRGVHIWCTSSDSKSQYHWWLDWPTKSFWPMTVPASQEPTAIYYYSSQNRFEGGVLLGGRDGFIRSFGNWNSRDDGTVMSSYVMYGPIKTGGNDFNDGMVSELIGLMPNKGGSVTWSVLSADDVATAISSTAFATGTWVAGGLCGKARPRARGQSFILKLANESAIPWSIERVTIVTAEKGKQRI
jgi:hypothetical protein